MDGHGTAAVLVEAFVSCFASSNAGDSLFLSDAAMALVSSSSRLEIAEQLRLAGGAFHPDALSGCMELLISHLVAGDQVAESLFICLRDHHSDALALALAGLIRDSPRHDTVAMSAVLFRGLVSRLSIQTRSSLKSVLLASLHREASISVSKNLCNAVSELAANTAWPELLPFMFRAITDPSSPPFLNHSALLIFSQNADHIAHTQSSHFHTLRSLLLASLSRPDVCVPALDAAVSLIQCLPSAADQNHFRDLVPTVIQALADSLNAGSQDAAKAILQLLIDLAGTEPSFLRRHLPQLVSAMLQIAEAQGLDHATRHLALELLITLAEAPETMIGRIIPQFSDRFFAVLRNMLLDIQDDATWHNAEVDSEGAGETSDYLVGKEFMARLAMALKGNCFVPNKFLGADVTARNWKQTHAALISIAQITQACSQVMLEHLDGMITIIVHFSKSPHPRLRWSVINSIKEFATHLAPDLHIRYTHALIPMLQSSLDDFQNPRLQAHAASAVSEFVEKCPVEILTPHENVLFGKLLALLESKKQMVRDAAWQALLVIANFSVEHLTKYYMALLPYSKLLRMEASNSSDQ